MRVPVPMGLWADVSQVKGKSRPRPNQGSWAGSLEPEEPADGFEQGRPAALPRRLTEGGDRPVQKLVLVQPKGRLDVLPLLVRQLAVEPAKQGLEHFAAAGLELGG